MKKSNFSEKVSLLLIVFLTGFPQISETIYTPALPSVARDLVTSVRLVEFTLAIYFLGFSLGVCFWGGISDWIGRRKAMLAGLAIYLMSCGFCSLTASVEGLLFWRFIQAFGASVGSVITQTILRDIYDGNQRAKVFSILCGALAFSPALGPVLGGTMSEFFGWRATFLSLILMGASLLIWSFISLPETKPAHIQKLNKNQVKGLIVKMFRSKVLWGHTFLIGATNGILFSFYGEAPFIFVDQLGMRPSLYGFLGILVASGTLVAARLSYLLNDHYTPEKIIQWGALTTFLGGIGLTILQYLGLFTLDPLGLSLSLLFLFSIFMGIEIIIPNSLCIALKDYQDMVGTAGSLFGAIYYLQIALFTWVMSLLHNGTAWPLPLYITFLGILLLCNARLISGSKDSQKTKKLIQC